jgi:ABC-type multidrug transport system permease subunit
VLRGLYAIVYKETRHIVRDFRTLFLMLIIPAVQLTIFGYAIELDVRDIHTAVFDLDGREPSRRLVEQFENTGYFKIVAHTTTEADLERAIVRGEARVGLRIPADFTDRLARGEQAQIQMLIDGSDSTVAMQALNVGNAVAMRMSIGILDRQVGGSGVLPVDARPRVLFNPDMRTVNFMVPGLVGIILQLVTMILTAFAIVREKENGTLEQLMVTPVSRLGLMLGKLIPYGIVGIVESVSVVLLMVFLFQVPIAGNVFLLAAFTLLFMLTTLGIGLLISTFATNQIQALQMAFLVILPSILLSGFVFPQETMPTPIWLIGQVVPVTYFIRVLRGIILRDAGLLDLWPNAAILALIAVVVIGAAALRFRKTLA